MNAPSVIRPPLEHATIPADAGDPRTVIALHGTGGHAQEIAAFARQLAPGAAVLALQGDVNEGGQARFFRRKAEGVYDMDDLARAIDRFDAWLGPALDAAGRSRETAVGLGFSNGANLLAAHAFARGPRLQRLALARPLIPYQPPWRDLSGQETLIVAGAWDPIAPAETTEALAAAMTARGATVETVWARTGHGLTQGDATALAGFMAPRPEAA